MIQKSSKLNSFSEQNLVNGSLKTLRQPLNLSYVCTHAKLHPRYRDLTGGYDQELEKWVKWVDWYMNIAITCILVKNLWLILVL